MSRYAGVVKFYDEVKGFGFIVPNHGGDDIFVHAEDVYKSGLKWLYPEMRIEYSLEKHVSQSGDDGMKAVDLVALSALPGDQTGTVSLVLYKKGYAFITPDTEGEDLFLSLEVTKLTGVLTIVRGDRFSFYTEPGKPGKSDRITKLWRLN